MSTNPPTAVMIPKVISSGFKTVLDLLELVGVGAELFGRRIVGLEQQRLDLVAVACVTQSQAGERRPEIAAQPLVHARHVRAAELALRSLFIDQRPLRRG